METAGEGLCRLLRPVTDHQSGVSALAQYLPFFQHGIGVWGVAVKIRFPVFQIGGEGLTGGLSTLGRVQKEHHKLLRVDALGVEDTGISHGLGIDLVDLREVFLKPRETGDQNRPIEE